MIEFPVLRRGGSGMVKVITIHGTNDGAEGEKEKKWWEPDSAFHQRLQQLIAEPLEFDPFHWSGANSERDRRRAGAALAKKIKKEQEPPVIIGHSHGGSVAIHSLLDLRRSKRKPKTLLTVGTPMIRFKPTWFWPLRFNLVGQTFLIYAVFLLAVVALDYLGVVRSGSFIGGSLLSLEKFSWPPVIIVFIYTLLLYSNITAAVIFTVLILFSRRQIVRARFMRQNTFRESADCVIASLNHSLDEAIGALRAGVKLNFNLASSRMGRRFLFGPIAILMIYGLYSVMIETVTYVPPNYEYTFLTATRDANILRVGLRDTNSLYAEGSDEGSGAWGELRSLQYETGRLTRTAYLRNDYLVFDLATAARKTTVDELVEMLEALGPTANANYLFDCRGQRCDPDYFSSPVYVGVYLTDEARDSLVLRARAIQERRFSPAKLVEIIEGDQYTGTLEKLIRYNYFDPDRPIIRTIAVDYDRQTSLIGTLLAPETLSDLSDRIIVAASRGGRSDFAPRAFKFPELYHGEAIVFGRTDFAVSKMRCLLSSIYERSKVSERCGFQKQLEHNALDFSSILLFVIHELNQVFEHAVVAPVGTLMMEIPALWPLLSGHIWMTLRLPFFLTFAWLGAWAMSLLVSPLLNSIFNNLIRMQIFGNDGNGESIAQVSVGHDFSAAEVEPLPDQVEADIIDYTKNFEADALHKFRQIVSLASTTEKYPLLTNIAECLTWKELIHTSYFRVDSFTQHLAQVLSDKAELTLVGNPPNCSRDCTAADN